MHRSILHSALLFLFISEKTLVFAQAPAKLYPGEVQLRNLRQATFGGENAEAYWSFDGKALTMQSTTAADSCDQIYTLDISRLIAHGSEPDAALRRLSPPGGRSTCSFFFPDGSRLLFSSTHHLGAGCPPPPDRSKGYVWPLYNYQIYTALPDGSQVQRLTSTKGYDAEATICHDGSVVFTSDRDGDLELYRMRLDGSGVTRLTNAPGYDGGAFFSEDCKRIVWRASRPRTNEEAEEMRALLRQRLVRPTRMDLWVSDADGSNAHQVTSLQGASFAPSFFPKGASPSPRRRIIFSSNHHDPGRREFDLFAIDEDGTNLSRVTFAPHFDGFPMFSPDGKRLAFSSNRGGKRPGETNVFIAEWVGAAPRVTERLRADVVRSRVEWLSAKERGGRGVGQKGLAQAADEIGRWMKEAGLLPAGAPGRGGARTYFQPVYVVVGVRDQGSTFRIEPDRAEARAALQPAPLSDNGEFAGSLVFAGYGISAPDAGWDDLSGIDLRDRIAVVLRGVPEKRFSQGAARSYSDLRYKAWNLREHGAQGVIFVDHDKDEIPRLTLDGPEGGAGLKVMFAKRALVAALMSPRKAGDAIPADQAGRMRLLRDSADAGARSAAFQFEGTLAGRISLARETRTERNVVGLLRAAADSGTKARAVVVGAHYDHLGMGGRGSFVPDTRTVHPGADDNASGAAALLEVAAALAGERLPMDLYFVAFTGEEVGLVGSSSFVKEPPPGLDMRRVLAMINFDMVGRLRSHSESTMPVVVIQGTDTAREWPALVTPLCQQAGLLCRLGGDGYGPSDMTPFYAAGLPVLFLFTGAHEDYHRPSDTADKINPAGVVQVAHLARDIVLALGKRASMEGIAPLSFQKASGPPPRAGDSRGGYGAYLGTIPDYTAMQGQRGGVKLSGARPGSPAAAAGATAGDVLVGLGGHAVDTLSDLAFVLRALRPGQRAELVLLRDGKKITQTVTLGSRPEK